LVNIIVFENKLKPIIGLKKIKEMKWINLNHENVNLSRLDMSNNKPLYPLKNMINAFPDVYEDKLGCLPGKYHIEVDPNIKPVVHAPRRVPVALKEKLKAKLHEMTVTGVIKSVTEPTDWVSSMVVVTKPNKDLWICIDPRDLNSAIKRSHYQLPTIEEITAEIGAHKSMIFSVLDAKKNFGKEIWMTRLALKPVSTHHKADTDFYACPLV
jgi:hypothetical protein